jgi:hypothetical protein
VDPPRRVAAKAWVAAAAATATASATATATALVLLLLLFEAPVGAVLHAGIKLLEDKHLK